MKIEFDKAKDDGNVAKHGISLARTVDLKILAFVEVEDAVHGETRYQAWGLIDGEHHSLVFTYRGDAVRPISLRRAHQKEIDRHVP